MVYRLYVETVVKNGKIAWAYTFYNHQDFMVYKRCGIGDFANEAQATLEISATALEYFEKSMRRRYYDEHFSTRIDEDYVTLYTHSDDIINRSAKVKSGDDIEIEGKVWERLLPFFVQKTMSFERSKDERFINIAKELALSAIK